jgi:hypothetical protein
MVVWGGITSPDSGATFNCFSDGGLYNPANDTWTAVTTNGAPSARVVNGNGGTSVWTGSQMLVWGGRNNLGGILGGGGCYTPAVNSWTTITTNGAPSTRFDYAMVWTGSEMIIWGGMSEFYTYGDGARYNPAGNSWTAMTANGAPSPRFVAAAGWTGNEMVIWNGGNINNVDISYYDTWAYSPGQVMYLYQRP